MVHSSCWLLADLSETEDNGELYRGSTERIAKHFTFGVGPRDWLSIIVAAPVMSHVLSYVEQLRKIVRESASGTQT